MMTVMKLIAAAMLALGILSPGNGTPGADTCECKAKSTSHDAKFIPRVDTCECKAKKTP